MSDIAISLNLLVELCFFIWEILKIILNLVCLKNNNRWGIDFSYWLKKLLQMIGPRSYCRTGGFPSRPFGKILSDICDLPREN